jgi:hypothetical protein
MKWLVVPDLQVPEEDPRSIELMCQVASDVNVSGILIVGDELDAAPVSQWSKGYANEYSKTLQKDIDRCVRVLDTIIGGAGLSSQAPIHLMRSNHGDRIRKYIRKYAPGLDGLRELEYERLMRFDALGVQYHTKPFEFAQGWVLAHGDEGSMSRIAGSTALGLAKKYGKSVVCGHTHRLGLTHDNDALNGRVTRHLFGMEVGHMMNLAKAAYTGGSANWNQGFALIEDIQNVVTPQLIPIIHRKAIVNGKVYRA